MKTIIQKRCPTCNKLAIEKSRFDFGPELWIELECGHTLIGDAFVPEMSDEDKAWQDQLDKWSAKGLAPFPYQLEGAKFLEKAGCNALLLDEQGLGKTIQECMILARNKKRLLPALGVVKSGLRPQWFLEIFKWTGLLAQIITSSREQPYFDHFDIVLVSVDTLRLIRPDIKAVSEWDKIVAEQSGKRAKSNKPLWSDETCGKFKHVFIDEIQKIKNPNSSRTQALRKIVSLSDNGNKAPVVGLSGTPIDKHAGEFFVGLNLVQPTLFPQQATYLINHVQIRNGKYGGLKNPERFKEVTKDFIIRRTRDQVMPDLPKVFRQFRLAEMPEGETEAYIKLMKEFQEFMDDEEARHTPTDILGYMSRMRHITGMAKVDAASEFLSEFLEECDRKITVFTHHVQAAQFLIAKLEKICRELGEERGEQIPGPLYLKGGMGMNERFEVEQMFREGPYRIAVASTLASCEGYNLQFCQDCLFMERQWNPTTEEQAESRFPRPRPEDPWPPGAKINAHYLIAAGTIDDFLTELVEQKRQAVHQTLDGEAAEWNENALVMELARTLQVKGLAKWSLTTSQGQQPKARIVEDPHEVERW